MKKVLAILLIIVLAFLEIPLVINAAGGEQIALPIGSTTINVGFYEYLPQGYENDITKKWPLVISLHGSSECGNGTTQLSRLLGNGLPAYIDTGEQYPFICISPQILGAWVSNSNYSGSVPYVDEVIEYAKTAYRVDTDRIYVTGYSLGGVGTWYYGAAYPDKVAAIVPICGPDITVAAKAALVNLPIWVFHCWGDITVSSTKSIDICNSIAGLKLGSTPTNLLSNYPGTYTGLGKGTNCDTARTASFINGEWVWGNSIITNNPSNGLSLTLYASTSHDSWSTTYHSQKMWDWLLAQKRVGPPPSPTPTPGYTIELDTSENRITLNGNNGGKQDKQVTTVVDNPLQQSAYLYQTTSDIDGSYTFDFKLSELTEGAYIFKIGGEDLETPNEVTYYCPNQLINITGCKYEKKLSEGVYQDISVSGLQAGTVKATLSMQNMMEISNVKTNLIGALYDSINGHNLLINAMIKNISVSATQTDIVFEFDVPEDISNPVFKIFIWDSFANNKPLEISKYFD